LGQNYASHLSQAERERTQIIGIPENETLFTWIAKASMNLALPDGWEEFTDNDEGKAYFHPKTKRLQRTHPMMDRFKALYTKCKEFNDRAGLCETENKMVSMLAVIMNEVLNRCNRELPPVTPELVERAALLFAVNTSEEFKMANVLKNLMAEFAEEQYDILVATPEKLSLGKFVERVRQDIIRIAVLEKPEETVMCIEYPEKPAAVKNLVTFEFYSLEGFAATHSKGKRQFHETAKVEQVVCSILPRQLATCEVDNVYYSDEGYRVALNKNPALRAKHLKVLGGFRCQEYPERRAEVLTEDTLEFLSWEAYFKLFRRRVLTGRLYHHLLTIDEEGYFFRMGQRLPPEEASRLIDKARFLAEGGEWAAFTDDQNDAYWYNLRDKVTTKTNPYFSY